MILVDTSAWIEFDRATESPIDHRLTSLMIEDADLAVTEPIVMELAVGARSDRHETDLRRLLARFHLLAFDAAVDFDGAALIYRACRRAGVTVRGTVDCMIAAVAARYRATILTMDADLLRIADVVGIAVDPAGTD